MISSKSSFRGKLHTLRLVRNVRQAETINHVEPFSSAQGEAVQIGEYLHDGQHRDTGCDQRQPQADTGQQPVGGKLMREGLGD